MRLTTRVTFMTTALVAPVLGVLGYAALRIRRTELEADLTRQAAVVADVLRASLEPLSAETAAATLTERAWRARERDEGFELEILKAPSEDGNWVTHDPGWLVLLSAAEIDEHPVGRLFQAPHGERSFAMAVPLYDEAGLSLPSGHPAKKPLAVIGMRRATTDIDAAIRATARRTFPLFVGVVIGLGVGVYLAMRAGVGRPLRRLVEGMNAVGEGDLSRVILAERDDEIGRLAGRFNAMTASLREARQESSRSAEARLALENRLHQSEKLATIGQLAAEIAHEVGTPLNVIVGRARSLARKASDSAEVTKNAEIIATQAGRITRIIQKVLDFSRKRGPTLTRVHLGALVAEALEFLSESIRRQGVQVVAHTMPSPDVPGDPDQLQQVCLNLMMNALHAMPHGGKLTIGLRVVKRRKEGLDLAAPTPYALLEIADTGSGVPAAHRDKVFEPFFTTKDEGQGTGLGLAVSLGIVKDHDGWIEVLDAKEAARSLTPGLGIALDAVSPSGSTAPPEETTDPASPGVSAAVSAVLSDGGSVSGPASRLQGAVFRVYLPLSNGRGTPAAMGVVSASDTVAPLAREDRIGKD